MIDLTVAEAELREYATNRGIDFDALLDAASQHFADDGQILKPCSPTEDEAEMVFEDEKRAEFA